MAIAQTTDSILESVKEDLGAAGEYGVDTPFDNQLIRNINAVLGILCQIGVGPSTPFKIEGATETWSDFLGEDETDIAGVETYVAMKVKGMFDRPTSAALIDADDAVTSELEWRLNVMGDKT